MKYRLSDLDSEDVRFRFKFKKGERVCIKSEGGAPNLDECGVIFDGTFEGQEGSGWYSVFYKVQVGDNKFFEVPYLQLVKTQATQ